MNYNENEEEYSVVLKNVFKSYDNHEVLKDLSLSFLKNKINCILGSSGKGKTTILNLIAGLIKQDKGEIFKDSKKISYMFQEDRLILWLNVFQNIEFVLKSYKSELDRKEIIDQFIDLVELKDYKGFFPKQLSGGMKRRVSMARALAYESDVLILDEPFKGLDNELKYRIIDRMLKVLDKRKQTIIMVTHDEAEAKYLNANIITF